MFHFTTFNFIKRSTDPRWFPVEATELVSCGFPRERDDLGGGRSDATQLSESITNLNRARVIPPIHINLRWGNHWKVRGWITLGANVVLAKAMRNSLCEKQSAAVALFRHKSLKLSVSEKLAEAKCHVTLRVCFAQCIWTSLKKDRRIILMMHLLNKWS